MYGLPWHKVLNAVVAELSIHKLKNQEKDLSDERFGAKLRVTENRCVVFDFSTYVYIYIYIYIFIYITNGRTLQTTLHPTHTIFSEPTLREQHGTF